MDIKLSHAISIILEYCKINLTRLIINNRLSYMVNNKLKVVVSFSNCLGSNVLIIALIEKKKCI